MNILTEVRDTETKILRAMKLSQQTTEEDVNQRNNKDNSGQVANSTTLDVIKLEILKLIKETRDSDSPKKTKEKTQRNANNIIITITIVKKS